MVSRHQRQGKKHIDQDSKDANNELRSMVKKLEKENRRLRQENAILKKEMNKSDKFVKKHLKDIPVENIVLEIDENLIEKEEMKNNRCPKCRAYYKESSLPHGILRICTNKSCLWREVIKI